MTVDAPADGADDHSLDLDLLRKFATGAGGRRTGALMRAGYLVIRVTQAGRRALDLPDVETDSPGMVGHDVRILELERLVTAQGILIDSLIVRGANVLDELHEYRERCKGEP